MIDKIYIKEAARIIEEYDLVINNINIIENKMKTLYDNLITYKKDLDILNDEEKELSMSEKYKRLNSIIENYDTEVNKLEKILTPYIEKTNKLKDDSKRLYTLLMDKYKIPEEELKEIIINGIEELKKEKEM